MYQALYDSAGPRCFSRSGESVVNIRSATGLIAEVILASYPFWSILELGHGHGRRHTAQQTCLYLYNRLDLGQSEGGTKLVENPIGAPAVLL